MTTVVVGAGMGGIASAILARLRGEEVVLYEAHGHLGGCASYFGRGEFVFDAGATTVSGIDEHGPLKKLFDLLGAWPEFIVADPGMVIHLEGGAKLVYSRDFESWMRELERVFPELSHRRFWKKVFQINEWGWLALESLFHPRNARLLPYLFVSTELMLKKHGLCTPEYKRMVDTILLISAQAPSENIPFFVGSMALAYPAQSYAARGGMKGLMKFLEKEMERLGIVVVKKKKVSSVNEFGGSVILNLPIWNVAKMLGDPVPKLKGSWGAFTVYLGVKAQVRELYQQVHLKNDVVDNYFISFSDVSDLERAPVGWQTVTISTHVRAVDWEGLSDDEYAVKKALYQKIIIDDFLKRFGITETKFLTSGTPQTFEFYTGRESGFVGGLPFLYGKNPLRLPLGGTSRKNVWMVGDTVFPGQGLVGVVAGAFLLEKRIRLRGA